MQPLFIQPDVTFEKISAEVDLTEDPNQWPHEILQELYKQVPYIADFEPHVEMQKVDSEQGYGMGHVTIATKTEAQQGVDPGMADAAGLREVRIPIIIDRRKLAPFDLLVNDNAKVVPLTEARLRQALFRPQMFDVTSQTPGDQSMIGQLYPPYRQNYGFGGGGLTIGSSMGKNASALESYLLEDGEKVASVHDEQVIKDLESKDPGFRRVPFRKTASLLTSTFCSYNKSDIDGFFAKLGSDHGLQAAYKANSHATLGPLSLLAHFEPESSEKRASALFGAIKPSVTQLTKTAEGYNVKTASHHYWNPTTVEMSRRDVVQTYGDKVALAADEAGQVTLESDPAPPPQESPLDSVEAAPVTEPGIYRVTTDGGQELVGFVIPNLLDMDGRPLPLSLFTNGSHTAVQGDILGIPAGGGTSLPTSTPQGSGAFFSQTDDGHLQATIPITLDGGSYAMPGEPTTLKGLTFDGSAVELSIQPNIQTIIPTPEGRVLVPEHWQWTPLGSAEACSLLSAESENEVALDAPQMPEEGVSTEEAAEPEEQKESHVIVRGDHDCFTFTGPAVEKMAQEERNMVGLDQAMFLLAGLGVDQRYGSVKLAHSFNGPQKVVTSRVIKTAAEQDAWALEKAAELQGLAPKLRRDLTKEAAAIPDPSAVDTVLSLGFINPENVMTYVSYLPTIEDSQQKMCELLLAARVGLSNVSESALERAVRSTEETLEGLKVLAFQGS